jgi:hypothetical protein
MSQVNSYIIELYVNKVNTVSAFTLFKTNDVEVYFSIATNNNIVFVPKVVSLILEEYNKLLFNYILDKCKLHIDDSTNCHKTYYLDENLAQLIVSYELFKRDIISKKILKSAEILAVFESINFISNFNNENFTFIKSKIDSILTAYKL